MDIGFYKERYEAWGFCNDDVVITDVFAIPTLFFCIFEDIRRTDHFWQKSFRNHFFIGCHGHFVTEIRLDKVDIRL